jgi:hypothetical protein
MTIARKYIRQCRTLFPVYGKSERTFLNRLKVQVNEHLDLFPDISYNELVKQFGSPREVVMEYYDNIEDDYLLSKIDLAKKVKKFLLFIAILFLVYFFYQSYTTYQALNLIKDQQIIYEKQGTIEETK